MYKLVFITTLFLGTLISISSMSWLGMWIGLEINLLSFIPLLNDKNNPYSSEASMKYFLVQAMASTILLFSLIITLFKSNFINEFLMTNNFNLMIMNSSLFLKMGAAPFHFWFPEIIEGMNWTNSMILMTWQKIAPMMLISYTINFIDYIFFIILISAMVGSLGGLNQISLRKLMAYSSINHISWMLSAFLINELMWILYFSVYTIIVLTLSMLFNLYNIFLLKQMYMIMKTNFLIKYFTLINLLSLGGLPPFLGFLPKWMIIQNLSKSYYPLLMFMLLMSLITLYFYLRISYSSMMLNHKSLNFMMILNKNYFNKISISILTFISMNGLILYTILFNFY
uniref:NADH-ubiquinone oxidoreductase chain 2 n=1 Tax=Cybister lateralimarginalis TaxID=107796 RepID=A0A343C4M0_9DYTI|nr:NADH dehydrogenase subunit 2 [Cybister lateralimarginalis]